jgi:streptogramin lyase
MRRRAATARRPLTVVSVLALVAAACGSGTHPSRPSTRISATSGLAAGMIPPRQVSRSTSRRSVCLVMASDIKIAAGVTSLASGDGALWVTGFGVVSRLDATSGRLIAELRTPGSDDYSQIAVGERAVWVTSTARGVVYRIDPVTDRVTTIHLDEPAAGIAVGGGRVWVTVDLPGPGRLIVINPRTNRVTGRPIMVGPGPGQVVYGQRAVWVQNTSPASVMRINPASGQAKTVIDTVPLSPGSPGPGAIAIGNGSLWSVASGALTRLAPTSGHAIANIAIARGVAIALGDREVWVVSYPRSSSPTLFEPITHTAAVREIDPHSDRIIGTSVRLNALQPIAITTTHNSLWVANFSGTVTRFRLVACHGTVVEPGIRATRSPIHRTPAQRQPR